MVALIALLLRTKFAKSKFKLLDNTDGVTSYHSLSPYQEVNGSKTQTALVAGNVPSTTAAGSSAEHAKEEGERNKAISKESKGGNGFKSLAYLGNGLGCDSSESLQLQRRVSPAYSSATSSLAGEDASYKELVTLSSSSPEQHYKELVTLNSRSSSKRPGINGRMESSVKPGSPWGREVISQPGLPPHPTLGVARVQSRDPPRDLHIPNPTMPTQPVHQATASSVSTPNSSSSVPNSSGVPSTSGGVPGPNVPFPASVARSLRNINPSRDGLRKFGDTLGQSLVDFKSTCQTTLPFNPPFP